MVVNLDPDGGVFQLEAPQRIQQKQMQRRVRGPDFHRAAPVGILSADFLLGVQQMPVRDLHMGIEQLPLLRQADAPGLPDEQPAVQLGFQQLHDPRHIGLVAA